MYEDLLEPINLCFQVLVYGYSIYLLADEVKNCSIIGENSDVKIKMCRGEPVKIRKKIMKLMMIYDED